MIPNTKPGTGTLSSRVHSYTPQPHATAEEIDHCLNCTATRDGLQYAGLSARGARTCRETSRQYRL